MHTIYECSPLSLGLCIQFSQVFLVRVRIPILIQNLVTDMSRPIENDRPYYNGLRGSLHIGLQQTPIHKTLIKYAIFQ